MNDRYGLGRCGHYSRWRISFEMELMHSPEVELTEIFVSNIFNGNGQTPSDKPPDTKNTTRGVHNFRILKIL